MSLKRVTVIGLGLIGGSLALALRRTGAAAQIVGCDCAEVLGKAREMGAIDSGCESAADSVAGSDLVFLCAPVETSVMLLAQIALRLTPGALVSDVGSTKNAFATAARQIFGDSVGERVLPGHPLAGREVSGLEHASGELFEGCLWILTPIAGEVEKIPTPSQRQLISALEAIGAHVVFSTPEEHDRTLAYTSHLPQLLSSALALTLEQAFDKKNPAVQMHAGGLTTMLRLAQSDPVMWEQIAASNRGNLMEALKSMEAELSSLRQSLGNPEFRKKLEQARSFARLLKK